MKQDTKTSFQLYKEKKTSMSNRKWPELGYLGTKNLSVE